MLWLLSDNLLSRVMSNVVHDSVLSLYVYVNVKRSLVSTAVVFSTSKVSIGGRLDEISKVVSTEEKNILMTMP